MNKLDEGKNNCRKIIIKFYRLRLRIRLELFGITTIQHVYNKIIGMCGMRRCI